MSFSSSSASARRTNVAQNVAIAERTIGFVISPGAIVAQSVRTVQLNSQTTRKVKSQREKVRRQ